MNTPILKAIVAHTPALAIGKDGTIPWKCKEDLAHFYHTTKGHAVIMGRKTFESLPEPLIDRQNIVITRNEDYRALGAVVAHNLYDAIQKVTPGKTAFIIGGGEIYRLALDYLDEAICSRFYDKSIPDADTFFPQLVESMGWLVTDFKPVVEDGENSFAVWTYTNTKKRPLQILAERLGVQVPSDGFEAS